MTKTTLPKTSEAVARLAALAEGLEAPSAGFLSDLRSEALAHFREQGLPHRKIEEWRETNVAPLFESHEWRPAGVVHDEAVQRYLDTAPHADLGLRRLVFVNGRPAPTLSSFAPSGDGGLWAGPASLAPDAVAKPLRETIGTIFDWRSHHIATLATALAEDAVAIVVPEGVQIDEALHVVHLTIPSEYPVISVPRTVVIAGRGARLTLVESFLGGGKQAYLSMPIGEFELAEDAEVVHTRVQLEGEGAFHLGAQGSDQLAKSHFVTRNVALGAQLGRLDVRAKLSGTNAHAQLDGLYVPTGRQHVDTHSFIDHAVPECTSGEIYKGILSHESKAVFAGRIMVRQDAQKTDARQQNDNLVLSTEALAQTRPQLEIYADDVKCAHGATVGRLDDVALFYLQTRGIDRNLARAMLIRAFADSVLSSIEVPALLEQLEHDLGERLSLVDEEVS